MQNFKYADVLKKGRPLHQNRDGFFIKRPPMPLDRRAKIFHPFDALKGFREAISEKDILCEYRRELSEENIRKLNLQLNLLKNLTSTGRTACETDITVSVTYFLPHPDSTDTTEQPVGTYETVKGILKNVDAEVYRKITLDETVIPIDDIIKMESDVFCRMLSSD